MTAPNKDQIAEMQADAEKARLFRDFATSQIWKKHLEPFLFRLQQDAEVEALTVYRSGKEPGTIAVSGALASGRAQAAEMFALFIVRGINDAKESEKKLAAMAAEPKKTEAAK